MATSTFRVHGMDCAEEVGILKAELGPVVGVENLSFDILNGKMTVEHVEASVTRRDIVLAVERTGMRLEEWRPAGKGPQDASGWIRWGRTVMTALSGLLLAAGTISDGVVRGFGVALGAESEAAMPISVKALYVLAAIAGAWFVAPKELRALLRLRPDMNLLMTVAVIGALFIDEFMEAATVAFLFAVSLSLESWSVGRARRAIAALMNLTPETARVLDANGREELVEAARVGVGTRLLVKPGDKIPLDGEIAAGETSVNQAPITGESMPVSKSVGAVVYAGTINQDGAIEVITTKPAQDTTLARIIRMVGAAQSKRGPSEQWVERFARVYTPSVMVLALLVMLVPPLLTWAAWSESFYQGLVLLVIACPCALVISTPVSIVAALTGAAREGVLVKGGPYIELPARLRVMALDKTGTLTEGRPEVREVRPLSGHSEREVLEIAAAIEFRSEHPLAQAIVRAANRAGLHPTGVSDFQAVKGKGATAVLDGKPVWLGSHRYLEERGQETPEIHDWLERMAADGASVVVIGNAEHVCGLIAVADAIRSNAKEAIAALHAAGIERVVMLTGDNQGTAEAVGHAVGVDEISAELLPEDKVRAVEELVARYGSVGMVGDGVNDAPALARANLGIAMGAVGTDAALETADVALMSDDVSRLAWLIHHAARTLSIIRQNIFASLGVKLIFVILTFGGYASLWAAITADMGTSLLVIFNGLRLLRAAPSAS